MSGYTRDRLTKDSTLEEAVQIAKTKSNETTIILFDDAAILILPDTLTKYSILGGNKNARDDLGRTDIHKPEQAEKKPEHSGDGEPGLKHQNSRPSPSVSRQSDGSDE